MKPSLKVITAETLSIKGIYIYTPNDFSLEYHRTDKFIYGDFLIQYDTFTITFNLPIVKIYKKKILSFIIEKFLIE